MEFVKLADERKNMLLHIFLLEAKAPPKRRRQKHRAQEPRVYETGRGYNWQSAREKNETGKEAGYAADGTLAARCFAGFETISANAGLNRAIDVDPKFTPLS